MNNKNNQSIEKDKNETKLIKRLVEIGVDSRRNVEKLIKSGVVKINSVVEKNPFVFVSSKDKITVKKNEVKNIKNKTKVYLMNKPVGYITSTVDEKGRKTIFDLVPKKLGNLITIGRLDYNTEGLLLLTNDGEYARAMELPSSKIKRVYHVKVFGFIDRKKLKQIEGVKIIDGVRYDKFKVNVQKIGEPYSTFKIEICEGKNREIRKVMEFFGLKVVKLVRLQYGPYKLKFVPFGGVIESKKIKKIEEMVQVKNKPIKIKKIKK